MNVRIRAIFCLIVAMLFSVNCYAVESKLEIRVGYWKNYGISQNDKGELSGYTYDYMNKIAMINNWDIEYISYSWKEGLKALADGKIDIFAAMQKTEGREKLYDYTELPFAYEHGMLYTKEDNSTAYYDDPKGINGKVIGSTKGNSFVNVFNAYCDDNDINVSYKYFDDSDVMNKALQKGELDYILTGSLRNLKNAKMALRLSGSAIYYPTTKGNEVVLKGLNNALNYIRQENLNYDAELNNKYYKNSIISRPAFSKEEKEYILKNPKLSVAYHNDFNPFDYYNQTTKKYEGISVDVMTRIGRYTGIEFVPVDTHDFNEALRKTANGEVDIIVDVIESKPMNRSYDLALSQSFMKPSLMFIGKRGSTINQLEGQNIAVRENNIGTAFLLEQDYPSTYIKQYKDTKDCLVAVINGEASFAVLNTYAVDEILRNNLYNGLAIVSVLGGDIPVCLGVGSQDAKLKLSILNKAIDAISQEEMNEIVFRHTVAVPYKISLWEFFQENVASLIMLILMFVLSLAILAAWSHSVKTKELNKMAYYDPLTGRINFLKLKIEIGKMLELKLSEQWAIVSLDINKFKSINDILGYDYGDKLIIHLAKSIAECMEDGEIFARENADEFILFIRYGDRGSFDRRFQRIAGKADLMKNQKDEVMKLILSGGIYLINEGDQNITSLIDRANIARKSVKNSHRSTYALYTLQMYEKLNREKHIENMMTYALEQGEFVVYLQPKFLIETRTIVGAEALIRWQSPQFGLIPPDDFIPLFEKNGFVVNIDFFVFRRICMKLKQWRDLEIKLLPISVNLSRCHIANEALAQELCGIAKEYSIPPGYIELELTESAFSGDDSKKLISAMGNLRNAGFVLSMDDFGSGLSSLTQLQQLPLDFLKLDKSFLDSKTGARKEEALFRNVVNLSRDMGIATVAEGVETEAQFLLLKASGCDIAQGFLLARPMTIEAFEKEFMLKRMKE